MTMRTKIYISVWPSSHCLKRKWEQSEDFELYMTEGTENAYSSQ